MWTPWGMSDFQKTLSPGIISVSTPSHGGIHLDDEQNNKMPEAMRNADGWYEEDCEWAKVAFIFPSAFKPEHVIIAINTVKNWLPHEYEKVTGIELKPEESNQLREEIWKENCVKGKAAFLGLMHEKPPEWTIKELKYLRKFCHKKSIRLMSQELHRSPNAVKIKCVRLHLHTRFRDGWYDKMDVCEMLGVDHHKVQAWIERGELKARFHTPDLRPSAKGMAMWHIEADDLKSFIICPCQELQGRNIDVFSILDLCGVIPVQC